MMNQTQLKEVEKLFELGAHLGHKKSRLHPKAKKNVYQIINGTTVIDLTTTVEQLEKAKKYLSGAAKENKTILVVGTKKTASSFLREYCATNKVPFVATKWLPGLLTNFKTIMQNVKKLNDFRAQVAGQDGTTKLVKHEKTQMQKQISKLEKLYGGFENLNERPDVILIVDTKKEKNAVKEAQMYNIPVVAIVDTNSNPEDIDYPVLANDDAAEVVEYLLTNMLDAYIGSVEKAESKEKKSK
mgnify:CR=1 FL=1